MSVRHIRLLLNSATALLCVGVGGVAWWASQSPVAHTLAGDEPGPAGNHSITQTAQQSVTADDFAELWSKPLRRPLYDPPPPKPKSVVAPKTVTQPRPKPAPKPTPPPKLDIRLVGTILEAGHSMAIMTDTSGKIDLKSSGELLDLEPAGVRIEEIEAESVTISYEGRQSQLKIGKTTGKVKSKGKGRRRNRNNAP